MRTDINIITCQTEDANFQYFDVVKQQVYGTEYFRNENINEQYLHSCVIALQQGLPAGRLCICRNDSLEHQGSPILLLGNFECINDKAVAKALFTHVFSVARALNIPYVVGPMNGSTWEKYRLPLTPAEDRYTDDLDYPLYYSELFVACGFEIMHRYYTSIADMSVYREMADAPADFFAIDGVRIRNIDMQQYAQELRKIYALCAVAFAHNVLFSPIDESGFINKYLPLASFIDPQFVFIAEDEDGVVALIFCYPDIICTHTKRLVVKTIVRHPGRRYKGLVQAMAGLLYKKSIECNYASLIHAYIHEDNKSLDISVRFGGKIFREYALFIKTV